MLMLQLQQAVSYAALCFYLAIKVLKVAKRCNSLVHHEFQRVYGGRVTATVTTKPQSERSFSALRRLKSYLRSTMGNERLNHLMVLHVHKERTDKLDLKCVLNEFVGESVHRTSIFAKYS